MQIKNLKKALALVAVTASMVVGSMTASAANYIDWFKPVAGSGWFQPVAGVATIKMDVDFVDINNNPMEVLVDGKKVTQITVNSADTDAITSKAFFTLDMFKAALADAGVKNVLYVKSVDVPKNFINYNNAKEALTGKATIVLATTTKATLKVAYTNKNGMPGVAEVEVEKVGQWPILKVTNDDLKAWAAKKNFEVVSGIRDTYVKPGVENKYFGYATLKQYRTATLHVQLYGWVWNAKDKKFELKTDYVNLTQAQKGTETVAEFDAKAINDVIAKGKNKDDKTLAFPKSYSVAKDYTAKISYTTDKYFLSAHKWVSLAVEQKFVDVKFEISVVNAKDGKELQKLDYTKKMTTGVKATLTNADLFKAGVKRNYWTSISVKGATVTPKTGMDTVKVTVKVIK